MKLRTDLIYSLIAFESILVAIASILWFPVWVLALAVAAFVFSTVELILNIVRMSRSSYVEEQGKRTYRFPVWAFVFLAALLICVTATVILAIKMLFGFMLIPVTLLVAGLLVLAVVLKVNLMKLICSLLVAVLAVFLISYGTAYMIHSGMDLNPGLKDNQVTPDTTPGDDTQTPGDDTQEPSDDIQTPGDDTQEPSDDIQTPGDDTQEPSDDTQTPGDDTQEPSDDTQTPVVTPKISAPSTMSYGVPVTLTLEGITADNLKYGGEDFVSIVKISDSQVVLTLVGIVNDAGQVQIVPASGYITVTDSVSGTNVSIRIVE